MSKPTNEIKKVKTVKRDNAKELLPAMIHFVNGGSLWFYDDYEWLKQDEIFFDKEPSQNIIEDKHFKSRKADALGEEVEIFVSNFNKQGTWRVAEPEELWLELHEYRTKQDTWKLPEYKEGSEYTINMYGTIRKRLEPEATRAGRRRATKELAVRAAKASKTRDLLEAWRDYLEPTWEDKMQEVFYIYKRSTYGVDSAWTCRDIGTVYGSEKTMRKICNALNSKEITL